MKKTFKIGSSRNRFTRGYVFPKETTATVIAEIITINGTAFYAGAIYTNNEVLEASMCWPAQSFEEFCAALLKKAYAAPKPF